ncbi:Rne/Rng family ribonuclease [Porticoccaceae bacterium]|nr:Rne/Rng family ribonuclease [Porticoccaceae bacterium]
MATDMNYELLINCIPGELRVALLEENIVQEVHIEREDESSIVGNIYLAKVVRVMPGLQAAFIDFGASRTGFLHVDDVNPIPQTRKNKTGADNGIEIRHLLHDGQSIIVQVVKEPIGDKGARLTAQVSIASRYLVFMPGREGIKISRLVKVKEERERLEEGLISILRECYTDDDTNQGSYIVRSAGQDCDLKDLKSDAQFLQLLWSSLQGKKARAQTPVCLHQELSVEQRLIRDIDRTRLKSITVDNHETLSDLHEYCELIQPGLEDFLIYYGDEEPLFRKYKIDEEIDAALHRKVDLAGGGYIVIDQTEALVAIDVNTGASTGRGDPEQTVYETNCQAAKTIARQLRLRNLSGIIVIDFIDMNKTKNQNSVLEILKRAMSSDRIVTYVSKFTELGLVQISRQRTYKSLQHVLNDDCSGCAGRGAIKSVETVSYEIWRELWRVSKIYQAKNLKIQAASEVIEYLSMTNRSVLEDFEKSRKCLVHLSLESSFVREKFNIISV